MATVRLGDLLKSKGLINDDQIRVALVQQKVTGDLLGDVFLKQDFVSSRELGQALAEQAGLEFADLNEYPVSEEALRAVPRDLAEKNGFIPMDLENERLTIGITNPSNIMAIDRVTALTRAQPRVCMVDTDSFHASLEKSYFFLENPVLENMAKAIAAVKATGTASGTDVTTLTDLVMVDGVRRNATDIHISPALDMVHVLYRIDGVLHYGHALPKEARAGLVSRIKILSRLDIAETRLPQDGSFSYEFLHKNYDIRVSTSPTIHGENVVMRILAGSGPLLRIDKLGFDAASIKSIKHLFQQPHGVVLIVGPTGSGKTTTLYAALREINFLERNVLTVEDPVEYRLSLIRQSQVNDKAGYDFAFAARNFMRQDPDVILIGEIRDEETARIAIRSSITGHLVLSTLHTNDAVTAIPRLLDLNVDRFLMSSALLAILAQRLVRKLCPFCKVERAMDDTEREVFTSHGITIESVFGSKGCSRCNGLGYSGRTVIGEVISIDDELRELIYSDVAITTLKAAAMRKGMTPLRVDGLQKVARGITSLDEIQRVAG
ncbi:MAG TPA: type II secretion system protein E [Syntrophobacteraceae bacterium]|nr:type II secretion system protein E [Syntrophobacteraceae bacterium]